MKDYNYTELSKSIIELSDSFDNANYYIENELGILEVSDKLGFLAEIFPDIQIVGRSGSDDKFVDYRAILTTIVNMKWR